MIGVRSTMRPVVATRRASSYLSNNVLRSSRSLSSRSTPLRRRPIIGASSSVVMMGHDVRLAGGAPSSIRYRHGSTTIAAAAAAAASIRANDSYSSSWVTTAASAAVVAATTILSSLTYLHSTTTTTASCEQQVGGQDEQAGGKTTTLFPAQAGTDEIGGDDDYQNLDNLPVYTLEDVAENDGQDGKPIWMTYGGVVYDVTKFIPNHPGGSEKILMAAGSAIEPFWHIYRQHFSTDLPLRMMEKMIIGRLDEKEQEEIDEQMDMIVSDMEDPYANEPVRSKELMVHSDQPMNAECPKEVLTEKYLTPSSVFYIRHHHPVPILTPEQIDNYKLHIDLTTIDGKNDKSIAIPLSTLKALPKVEVTATLQCSGNLRKYFNEYKRTSGTPWGQGAVSTAKWGGVRLRDVLELIYGMDPIKAEDKDGIKHVRFESLDGMMASIPLIKAVDPYGDVILAYEMNDDILPLDHGFPLRVIVPGFHGVRSVKWINKIEMSKEESEGPWQRGLNYKTLPPCVEDASTVDVDSIPSVTEASLFSGITHVDRIYKDGEEEKEEAKPGDEVMIRAKGWAFAGGGRNIVRVDLTGNNGTTWQTANITHGSNQKYGRAWAWTFWTADIPATVRSDGTVELSSKAVDMAFNVQPERCDHVWNVRGLGNNSWFRTTFRVH